MERNGFKLFIELIEFDQSLSTTTRALHTLRAEIEKLAQSSSSTVQLVTKEELRVKELRKEVDSQEQEMRDLDDQLKKARERLELVHNEREYHAIKEEINRVKKRQHDYEATLIETWTRYESAQKELIKKQEALKIQQEEIKQLIGLKQEQVDAFQKTFDQAEHARAVKQKDVPIEWIEKYTRMRDAVANPVVMVAQESCSACFYKLPNPDLQLIARHELIQCKGCYRLLYGDMQTQESGRVLNGA